MSASTTSRIAMIGLVALLAATAMIPSGAQAGKGPCNEISLCPTSQAFISASLDTCSALVPDYTSEVAVDLCVPEFSCVRIEQSPPADTPVAIGEHEITLTAIVCVENPARGDNTNGNDNTGGLGNDICENGECFTVGTCIVNLSVSAPQPELVCPEGFLPAISVNSDCSVTVPNVLEDVTIESCSELSGILIEQEPAAGSVIPYPGFILSVRVFVNQLEAECFVSIPVEEVTSCPEPLNLFADGETCTATLPSLCDAYILECQEPDVRGGIGGTLTCRTEPAEQSALGVGEHSVQIIVEECFFGRGSENCNERPDLGCTVTVNVEGPFPQLKCPTTQPVLDAIDISADCTVVVPDVSELVEVNACPGTEYELIQSPEAGSTIEAFGDTLYVFVFLSGSKGPTCVFEYPLNLPISCPDSPQTIAYDANCEAVVPDLTDEVDVPDCCSIRPTRAEGVNCEIRKTQTPEAGSPLTGPTEVTITIERCFTFGEGEQRGIGEECTLLGSCVVQLNPVDNTPPVIENCPDDLTLGADADCLGAVPDLTIPNVTGLAIATDNCTATADIVLTQSPAAGTQIELGVTVVTVTATDEAGNTATCSVTIDLEANGCNTPPEPEPEPEPAPQPVPGCDANNQSLNLLFSLLFHSPVCGATCPFTMSLAFCGIFALRRGARRRRR